MPFEPCQAVSGTDERERAIGTRRGIRELCAAIAADTIAGDGFKAEVHFLVEGPQSTGADATASGAAVVGAEAAHYGRCRRCAGSGEHGGSLVTVSPVVVPTTPQG